MKHPDKTLNKHYVVDDSATLLQIADLHPTDIVQNDYWLLSKAKSFAEPFIANEYMHTGEYLPDHVEGVAKILKEMGGSETLQIIAYVAAAWPYLNRPIEVISKNFGADYAKLSSEYYRLINVRDKASEQSENKKVKGKTNHVVHQDDIENARRMLLAFSRDLRVVFLVLASGLQILRYFARVHQQPAETLVKQIQHVYAPLANRLGLRSIKWELEDLSFRFLEPALYYDIAKKLGDKRINRVRHIEQLCQEIQQKFEQISVACSIHGRPKNIYGIYKKMHGKSLPFERVFDILAMRVLVESIDDCYLVLDWFQQNFQFLDSEFDDYIANPKSNGYQSIHAVVKDEQARPIEVQIRTYEMHDKAESGVAAHWAYKEAGTKGYGGVSATGSYDQKIAVLRNLLEWRNDLSHSSMSEVDLFDDRIYVFTPQARLIDLPQGSTALDFAYALHTDLGHRCRGAKVDGNMVQLNTALQNGQNIEIISIKEGGPSRDWLNSELKYLVSAKAKAKVRAWFNQIAMQERLKKGRESIEKLLQRKGKTSIKLDDLASKLGFKTLNDLFDVVGREEYSLKNIESILAPEQIKDINETITVPQNIRNTKENKQLNGVLVVGVGSLLTQLARCCRPAPPDNICGYVTRGKGVSIHRSDCTNLKGLLSSASERMVEVSWDETNNNNNKDACYLVDLSIECVDYINTLREVLDLFAKLGNKIVNVNNQTIKSQTIILLSIEMKNVSNLSQILTNLRSIKGVLNASRAMN